MKQFLLFALIAICIDFAYANPNADIYVCTDGRGQKTYANVGDKKGCKKVDLPGLMIIPAPNTKRAGKEVSKTSSTFPTIDDVTQKRRDDERRQILDEELKTEKKKLANLNAEYKNGQPDRLGNERNYAKYQERTENLKQDINRSQQNIEALQREISGLRQD